MTSITISNRDDTVTSPLLAQAAVHGRPMEDEAGEILRASPTREPPAAGNLAAAIRARFAPLGGVELPTITRDLTRAPPSFDE